MQNDQTSPNTMDFKYQEDKFFENPISFEEKDDYPAEISGWFNNSELLKGSNEHYVYCQSVNTYSQGRPFLCTNWAAWRTKHKIAIGAKAPCDETNAPIDSTTATVKSAREDKKLLKSMRLQDPKNPGKFIVVECSSDDEDRMLILWSQVLNIKPGKQVDPDKELIGHVSVKPTDRAQWESKLSVAPFVILHDENLFRDYCAGLSPGEKLRPALYYKYAASEFATK